MALLYPNDLQIFLRMRPAAILLHGAAATNPRFKGTGCSGQWGSPKELRALGAPLRQAAERRRPHRYMLAPETTDSSAEAVQGDPLSAREISSWWDFCTRGMVSCTGFISSPANHVSIAPLGWSWSLLGMLIGGWRVDEIERRRWRLRFWAVAMRACKGERCLVEPS